MRKAARRFGIIQYKTTAYRKAIEKLDREITSFIIRVKYFTNKTNGIAI